MDSVLIVAGILFIALVFFKLAKQNKTAASPQFKKDNQPVQHFKKDYLATQNEQKLYFALQKALNKNYHIHCQTSLIAIVEPNEFKHKKRAYSKRMDFVITDTATKIIAVIELDDASHNNPKRIKRDNYVNQALKPHHPLIRLNTKPFYKPEEIAAVLETKAGIKNIFKQEEKNDFGVVNQGSGV